MRFRVSPKPAAILLAALCCLTALAEPRIVLPQDPAGTEVWEAAADFWTKFADRDWKGAKTLFAGPPDQVELLDAHITFHTAAHQFHEAFVARFRAPTLIRPDSWRRSLHPVTRHFDSRSCQRSLGPVPAASG